MTGHRSDAALSRRTALASLGAGGLALALANRGYAAAQEGDGNQAAHPIVGAWQWNNNPDTPLASTSLAIFHADGAYVEFDPAIGVGIGAWAGSGERSGVLTIKFQDNNLAFNAFAPGIGTFRMNVEVDESGNALTAAGDLEGLDSAGKVSVNLPYTGQATRLIAEGPGTEGTPAASSPA